MPHMQKEHSRACVFQATLLQAHTRPARGKKIYLPSPQDKEHSGDMRTLKTPETRWFLHECVEKEQH